MTRWSAEHKRNLQKQSEWPKTAVDEWIQEALVRQCYFCHFINR